MRGVSESVEEGYHVFIQIGIYDDHVMGGYADVLSKSTVSVHTHAYGILAPLDVAVMTVPAVSAGYVSLAAYSLSDLKAFDSGAELCYLTYVFMASGHGRFDMLSCPGVPLVYMNVSPADRSLVDLYQDFSRPGNGYRYSPQFQSGPCDGLYYRIHHSFHFFHLFTFRYYLTTYINYTFCCCDLQGIAPLFLCLAKEKTDPSGICHFTLISMS